jgi:hypothetical protein
VDTKDPFLTVPGNVCVAVLAARVTQFPGGGAISERHLANLDRNGNASVLLLRQLAQA